MYINKYSYDIYHYFVRKNTSTFIKIKYYLGYQYKKENVFS